MTTLAVTGYMDLTDDTVPVVRAELDALLAPYASDGLVGLSCIAKGVDSLFAQAVLEAGGRLVVVVPSRDYRKRKVTPDHAAVFDRLTAAASEVLVMPHETATREAYEAANGELLRRADRAGLPVDAVWPEGAARRG
ncbi:hypothetical protein [Streptomyces alkaliterrae]|uniref:DUF1273 family protein n=1 Tax=Streptomyces alkaliterrae TaxID=2213162 RepID=A0A5P0YWB1_9ACTN|nr:hypothetical protein [Streptomyces alkaliterrae]MBB1261752.1 hypothetical protein [Streptomyces alkaliterrae]MQS04571.1 hypothetical protein [Streptomyces alkaliterrae]